MILFTKIIKEPLVHFLVVGFLLFVWFGKCAPNAHSAESNTIVVNKEALLTLMQYRSKAFKGDFFEQKLDNLSTQERQQLIDDYVREEALYREAQQLNLAEDDYIIKRRMIQKVDFIYQNRIEQNVIFPEDSLRLYFENHKEQYQIPAYYTFSHIFFKAETGGFSTALAKATSFLKNNKTGNIDFNQSLKYGERFLYHRHYVERDLAYLEGHFGKEFAATIQSLTPNNTQWSSPIKSEHGYHLLLVTNKKEAEFPAFDTIKSAVTADYKRTFEKELKAALTKAVIDQYKVIIDL